MPAQGSAPADGRKRAPDPFARPLDHALERLRAHGLPYRGDAVRFNTWRAVCPFCRVPAWTLVLREHGQGGSIDLRCASGCDQADIATALGADPAAWRIEAAEAHEAVAWETVTDLRALAVRALALAATAHVTPQQCSGLRVVA
jgi:hypothetical protein